MENSSGAGHVKQARAEWTSEAAGLQQKMQESGDESFRLVLLAREDKSFEKQATAAALDELKAAKAYNDFLDKDKEYWAKGDEADQKIRRGAGYDRRTGTVRELPGYDRLALEHSRDKNWALAGEFQMFKTENGLRPVHLPPVNTPTDTHFVDGSVERRDTVQGKWESAKGWAKDLGKDFSDSAADFIVNGPLTPDQNHKLCKSTVGVALGLIGGRVMPAPGGGHGATIFEEAIGHGINVSDPASTICDPIYRDRRPVDLRSEAAPDAKQAVASSADVQFQTDGSFGNLDAWLDQALSAASTPGQDAKLDGLLREAANDPAGQNLLAEAKQAEDQRELGMAAARAAEEAHQQAPSMNLSMG